MMERQITFTSERSHNTVILLTVSNQLDGTKTEYVIGRIYRNTLEMPNKCSLTDLSHPLNTENVQVILDKMKELEKLSVKE